MMPMGPWMMGGGGPWWGWLVMLLFWVALILAVVWGVRLIFGVPAGRGGWCGPMAGEGHGGPRGGRHSGEEGRDEALEILRQRYARGEISREEFLRLRDDLEGGKGA